MESKLDAESHDLEAQPGEPTTTSRKVSLLSCLGAFTVLLVTVSCIGDLVQSLSKEAIAGDLDHATEVAHCRPSEDLKGQLVIASCPHVRAPVLSKGLPEAFRPFFKGDGFHGGSLKWEAEFYQWVAYTVTKSVNGIKVHSHNIAKTEWVNRPLGNPEEHKNVGTWPATFNCSRIGTCSGNITAPEHSIALGSSDGQDHFTLPRELVEQMPQVHVPLDDSLQIQVDCGDAGTKNLSVSTNGDLTTCGNCLNPRVGDLRVKFHATSVSSATVAGKLVAPVNSTRYILGPYPSPSGSILHLEPGVLASVEFEERYARHLDWQGIVISAAMMWGLAAMGFCCMLQCPASCKVPGTYGLGLTVVSFIATFILWDVAHGNFVRSTLCVLLALAGFAGYRIYMLKKCTGYKAVGKEGVSRTGSEFARLSLG